LGLKKRFKELVGIMKNIFDTLGGSIVRFSLREIKMYGILVSGTFDCPDREAAGKDGRTLCSLF